MSDRIKELLRTMWICSTVAAVFTEAGIWCLIPAAVITLFAVID
jgi:hypothetical protein